MIKLEYRLIWQNPYNKEIWRGVTDTYPIKHTKITLENTPHTKNGELSRYYHIHKYNSKIVLETLLQVKQQRRSNINKPFKPYIGTYHETTHVFNNINDLNTYLNDKGVEIKGLPEKETQVRLV